MSDLEAALQQANDPWTFNNALRETIRDLVAEVRVYKKAKAENDERFMLERDEARRQLAVAREALEWYRDWSHNGTGAWNGQRAREALVKIGGE